MYQYRQLSFRTNQYFFHFWEKYPLASLFLHSQPSQSPRPRALQETRLRLREARLRPVPRAKVTMSHCHGRSWKSACVSAHLCSSFCSLRTTAGTSEFIRKKTNVRRFVRQTKPETSQHCVTHAQHNKHSASKVSSSSAPSSATTLRSWCHLVDLRVA